METTGAHRLAGLLILGGLGCVLLGLLRPSPRPLARGDGRAAAPDRAVVMRAPRGWAPLLARPRQLPGPREPSGAVALPKLGGLLVVDDEPKASPSGGIHFLRVAGDRLKDIPVHLSPGERVTWNDWEGATASETSVFLLASHGGRGRKRAQLCTLPLTALRLHGDEMHLTQRLRCVGGKPQRRALLRLIKEAGWRHGFSLPSHLAHRADKAGGLNIEGFAYDRSRQRFYVGLRSPLATRGGRAYAILLSMTWREGAPDFAFAGLLDLGGRGVRALTPLPDGSLLVSAGPPGAHGRFDLMRLRIPAALPFRTVTPVGLTPAGLPTAGAGFRPEAFAVYGRHLFVLSDSGAWPDRPAHYCRLPLPSP